MTTLAATIRIDTFQDILDALAQNPELEEQVRRHLQNEDFRNLPQTVARLAEIVQGMAEREERRDADIAELKAGQDELRAGQAELKEGQARLEARLETGLNRVQGGLDRLAGTDYERNIARRLRRSADDYFGIYRAELIHSVTLPNNNALPDLLDDAFTQGLISREEANSAEVVDMVIRGVDQARAPRYAVIEASVSVHQDDVDRALSRSRIIAKATAASVVPAVVGVNISDPVRSYAAGLQVVAIVMPD